MAKIRISDKSLKQFPKHVREKIRSIQQQYRTHSFSFTEREEGKGFYLGEGDRYFIFYAGKTTPVSLTMGSEHVLGATGLNWEIGGRITPPGAAIVLCVSYLGGYHLHIDTYKPVPVEIC